MKKHGSRDEIEKVWNEISDNDLDTLRAAMKEKTQERMNGRLQSRFFQVMFDWNVLRLMTNGNVSMMKPLEFTKWNRANSMIEAADDKQIESMFEAYPEEKAAWQERVAAMGREVRAMNKRI